MHLNHLNLGVTDVPRTVAMVETYCGLRPAGTMPLDDKMAFLRDDGGALIGPFRVKDATYPKIFHIGFIRDTVQEVVSLHAALSAGGFQPDEPREEHGRLTFYFQAPGGFMVDVNSFA